MDKPLLTGPAPQVPPMIGSSGQSSALAMTVLNQQNASALNKLAGGYKRRRSSRSRRSRRSKRTKRYKTKGRKLTRRRRNKRSTKRSTKRLYKGGANVIPYSAPIGSNAAVLNISEELALAHATANTNAKFDGAVSNAR